jgi:hypothetical protein
MMVAGCVVDEGRLMALFEPSFCQTHYMWFECIESDLEVRVWSTDCGNSKKELGVLPF